MRKSYLSIFSAPHFMCAFPGLTGCHTDEKQASSTQSEVMPAPEPAVVALAAPPASPIFASSIRTEAGGANRACVETVPVEVTNRTFRIDFTSQIENPQINAIEVVPQP